MEKKTNTPALRFREFSGEWQNKAIVDLSETTYGGGTPATVNPDYWNGDIPWIQSSDISEENLWEVIPRKHISKSAVKESAAKIIPANSIAIIVRVGVGKLAFLPFSYATSQDFLSLSDLKIDEYFGTCAIWKRLQADLSKVQGTSIKGVTKEELLAKKVAVPVTEKEAKKIGELAYIFDQNIIHRQRKIADLERFRQAMLTKLFPAEGASEPALRFKGYASPWIERKVGEILVERNEQAPKSKEYPLKAFVAYDGIVDKGKRYDRSALVTDTETKLYKKTEYGDFIYSSNNLETGSIGLNKYGKASISPVYSIFHPTDLGVSDFIGYRLIRKDFIQAMIKWRQGVIYGQWRIPESDFLQISIMVPSVEEQKKIGDFFRQLDSYISLQKEKLEKMRLLKAALLDKLFV